MALEAVSTLWIGGDLSWVEQMCLSSFVALGQPVALYSYAEIGGVPDGVEVRDASALWTPPPEMLAAGVPALVADIFRLHLIRQTDETWIDADMIAIRPFERNAEGYAVGFATEGGEINNAVLRLPSDSPALTGMLEALADPDFVPPWMRRVHKPILRDLPHTERLIRAHKMVRASFGPRALTHFMKAHSVEHLTAGPDVYYGVPWPFTDLLFAPIDRVSDWMTPATQGIHLWKNLTRKYHFNRQPMPSSFIGKLVAQYGIDVSSLKAQ